MSAVNPLGRQSNTTEYTTVPTQPIDVPRRRSNSVSPKGSPTIVSPFLAQAPSLIQQNSTPNLSAGAGFNGMKIEIPQGDGKAPVVITFPMGMSYSSFTAPIVPVVSMNSASSASSVMSSSSTSTTTRPKQMRDLTYTELRERTTNLPKSDLHLHLEGANSARKLLEIAAQENLYVLKKIRSKGKKVKEIFADKEEIKGKESSYITVAQLMSQSADAATADLRSKLIDDMTMMAGTKNPRVDVPAFHEAFRYRGEIRDKTSLGPHIKEIINACEAQNTIMAQLMYDKTATNPPQELNEQFLFPYVKLPDNLENFDMKGYIDSRQTAFINFKNSQLLKDYVARCVEEITSEIDSSEDYVKECKGWEQGYTHVQSPVTIRLMGEVMRNKEPWEFFVKLLVILELMKSDKRFISFTITGPEHETSAINWFVEQVAISNFLCSEYQKETGIWPNNSYHAGETHNTFASDTFLNWFPKIILDFVTPKRISHGNSFMLRHFKMLADCGTALEVCVKSNEVMFGVDPKDHHIGTAIRQGCTVIPCSDDPGTLESSLSLQCADIIKKQKTSNSTFLNMERGAIHCCDYPGESPYKLSEGKYIFIPTMDGVDRDNWKPNQEAENFLARSEKAQLALRLEKKVQEFEKNTGVILRETAQNVALASPGNSDKSDSSGSDSDDL